MDFISIGDIFLNDGVKFFNLANIYYYGINIEPDFKVAYDLYFKSASLGISEAQNMLGVLYFNGQGIDSNIDESIKYFEKAKYQGNTTAIFNLAMIYLNVESKKDYTKSYDYLQQLADLGYSLANDVLGYMYYNGIGKEKDYTKALEYWNKSSNNVCNSKSNETDLEDENIYNEDLFKDNTIDNFEQISSTDSNTFSIQDIDSYSEKMILADNYFNGTTVDIDYVKAFTLYSELAELGNMYSQIKVANMYKDGLGVNKDYAKSIEWYSKTINTSK